MSKENLDSSSSDEQLKISVNVSEPDRPGPPPDPPMEETPSPFALAFKAARAAFDRLCEATLYSADDPEAISLHARIQLYYRRVGLNPPDPTDPFLRAISVVKEYTTQEWLRKNPKETVDEIFAASRMVNVNIERIAELRAGSLKPENPVSVTAPTVSTHSSQPPMPAEPLPSVTPLLIPPATFSREHPATAPAMTEPASPVPLTTLGDTGKDFFKEGDAPPERPSAEVIANIQRKRKEIGVGTVLGLLFALVLGMVFYRYVVKSPTQDSDTAAMIPMPTSNFSSEVPSAPPSPTTAPAPAAKVLAAGTHPMTDETFAMVLKAWPKTSGTKECWFAGRDKDPSKPMVDCGSHAANAKAVAAPNGKTCYNVTACNVVIP
ncbi:MAG: hypothetical protein WC787_03330 [Patescibacteria group bacterium]